MADIVKQTEQVVRCNCSVAVRSSRFLFGLFVIVNNSVFYRLVLYHTILVRSRGILSGVANCPVLYIQRGFGNVIKVRPNNSMFVVRSERTDVNVW